MSYFPLRLLYSCSQIAMGQNQADRTNLAIGNVVVDGTTIEWQKHKGFEGLTTEEKNALYVRF